MIAYVTLAWPVGCMHGTVVEYISRALAIASRIAGIFCRVDPWLADAIRTTALVAYSLCTPIRDVCIDS